MFAERALPPPFGTRSGTSNLMPDPATYWKTYSSHDEKKKNEEEKRRRRSSQQSQFIPHYDATSSSSLVMHSFANKGESNRVTNMTYDMVMDSRATAKADNMKWRAEKQQHKKQERVDRGKENGAARLIEPKTRKSSEMQMQKHVADVAALTAARKKKKSLWARCANLVFRVLEVL